MTLEDVDDAVDPVHSIGVYTGYFNIHQKPQEGDYKSNNTKNENKREEYNATAYLAAQNRGIITRQHTPHKHQLYLFCSADASAHLLQSQPPATATSTTKSKRCTQISRGAGWQTDNWVLRGLAEADDFLFRADGRCPVGALVSWSRCVSGRHSALSLCHDSDGYELWYGGCLYIAGEVDTTCGRGTTKGVNDANSPPKNSTSTNLTTALKT